MQASRSAWRLTVAVAVAAATVALGSAGGCGSGSKTPALAYQRFAAAVQAGDGGALFDALDQKARWNWMSVQKWHREAYDIVLSNYPEGTLRESEKRRFETAATATSARELFRAEVAPGLWATLRPMVATAVDVKIEPGATDAEAWAVLPSGTRVPLAQGRGGWGFAGLDPQAEDQRNRAYHDLEVVRASAADYERAAARAAK